MKKTLLGIAGVLAMISSANAEFETWATAAEKNSKNSDITTQTIRTACQNSDKTLWDESNSVCIPRNPCRDSKYERYCIRDLKTITTFWGNNYVDYINIYAKMHNIDCRAVQQNRDLGTDYVVCQGRDLKVFDFGNTYAESSFSITPVYEALCKIAGGRVTGIPADSNYDGRVEVNCFGVENGKIGCDALREAIKGTEIYNKYPDKYDAIYFIENYSNFCELPYHHS